MNSVNYNLKSTPFESWTDRAKRVVASAPNDDWKKFGYEYAGGEYEFSLRGYNTNYQQIEIGSARAVAFKWTGSNPSNKSFVGFLVSFWNGALEATPIINLEGVMTQESINRSFYSAASYFVSRRCPKCEKIDRLVYSRTRVRCAVKGCGYKESTL